VGQHRTALASRLLGLDGFEILAAEVVGGEWQLVVQTTATVAGCRGFGMRAEFATSLLPGHSLTRIVRC
jgi:hypothetical protein